MESLERRFQVFPVEAHVWLDFVMPVNVLGYGGDLGAADHLILQDAVEPFQFPVRLGVVDSAENMLDPLLGEVLFEFAYALLLPFAFAGVELCSSVG